MDVILKHINIKKIKLGLVFFAFTVLLGCKKPHGITDISINYDFEEPVSISFLASEEVGDLKIYIDGDSNTPVLGEFSSESDLHTFTPIVPFSHGLTYYIQNEQVPEVINYFTVKSTTLKNEAPELIAIYPSLDTVPENLLKVYLQFSKPMQEVGRSLDYVTVTKNSSKQALDVFLDLESELWNADHTRLTLWLDPGRIKTDLIPNKEKGPPLLKGNTYTIAIAKKWRDANGISLNKAYTKTYYVGQRDAIKPAVENWKIDPPESGLKGILTIHFNEFLDAVLANETIDVFDDNMNRVEGEYNVLKGGRQLAFIPKEVWKPGHYSIKLNTKLEDLAGNNLTHLFDVDTQSNLAKDKPKTKNYIKFTVQ